VNVSVRPESISVVDGDTRDRWVVETADRTLDRIAAFEDDENEYAAMAREQYERFGDAYMDVVSEALESLDDTADADAPEPQA
jgi:RPA family protein